MALIGEMKYLTIGGNTYSIPVPDLSSKVSKTGDTMTGELIINSANGALKFYTASADYNNTITLRAYTRKDSYDQYGGYLSTNGPIVCSTTPFYDNDLTNKLYVDTKFSTVLPSVSSSDNGKVLMVVNGVWTKASLPTYNGGVS